MDTQKIKEMATNSSSHTTYILGEALFESAKEIERLRLLVREIERELQSEEARINWLENEAKTSRTGITISWMSKKDAIPLNPGYRLMRFHKVFNAKPTLRDTIDDAIFSENLHKTFEISNPAQWLATSRA